MVYKIHDVMRDVRVCLDQNNSSEPLIDAGDIDTLTLDEIIASKITEGVRRVEIDAPVYLLEQGHNFGGEVHWADLGSGYVYLPDDFMRLLAFRMSDWERTVYTAISTDDTEYEKLSSRYKGVRGNPQRPVCAIAARPEGRALEFYSCRDTSAEVSIAMYLPEPSIDRWGGIEISERCHAAAIYMIASLTALTCGNADKGNMLAELSKSTLK